MSIGPTRGALLLFWLGLTRAQSNSFGGQHVGERAKELRDQLLAEHDGPVHNYNPEEHDTHSSYDHMPRLVLHPSGQMDVISVTVVGTDDGQSNPYGTKAIWVEDEGGTVLYLHEGETKGGFAVPDHLLGSVLTGYNLDDSGLWHGPPLEVPPHKDEL